MIYSRIRIGSVLLDKYTLKLMPSEPNVEYNDYSRVYAIHRMYYLETFLRVTEKGSIPSFWGSKTTHHWEIYKFKRIDCPTHFLTDLISKDLPFYGVFNF
jgi:hypothetical protein